MEYLSIYESVVIALYVVLVLRMFYLSHLVMRMMDEEKVTKKQALEHYKNNKTLSQRVVNQIINPFTHTVIWAVWSFAV